MPQHSLTQRAPLRPWLMICADPRAAHERPGIVQGAKALRCVRIGSKIRRVTMVSTGVGRVCIAVVNRTSPTDAEWSRWLELIRERRGQRLRVLVETSSGPNATQRRALARATSDIDVRFAILTDSIVVRGIVTALAWLGVPHHAFATHQFAQATRYLELDDAEIAQVQSELLRLRREASN